MTGSPIEALLLEAICETVPSDSQLEFGDNQFGTGDLLFFLEREVQVGRYRVDFMIEIDGGANGYRIAVECDGRKWHERTEDQGAHDRSRDRELLTRGVITIRFTGSEIYRDAQACAADVWRCAKFLDDQMRNSQLDFTNGWESGARREREWRA